MVLLSLGLQNYSPDLPPTSTFPTLNAIVLDFDLTLDLVNLTITSYLIIQAVSPIIWGSFSVALGQRAITYCLSWNGVIQDILSPLEHRGYFNFYQAIRNFSIAVGPVFGGVLSQTKRFRSNFIFLLILSLLTISTIVLFLPGTMCHNAGTYFFPSRSFQADYLLQWATVQDDDTKHVKQKDKPVTFMNILQPVLLPAEN
ncbi:hypothetical protein BC830DRAFT_947288 [Chytriomyces sp. MP71]|nr:hypothetical protein BC830DRAFT_947288 [Chytriomyces sp. MP71]